MFVSRRLRDDIIAQGSDLKKALLHELSHKLFAAEPGGVKSEDEPRAVQNRETTCGCAATGLSILALAGVRHHVFRDFTRENLGRVQGPLGR